MDQDQPKTDRPLPAPTRGLCNATQRNTLVSTITQLIYLSTTDTLLHDSSS